MRFTGFLLKHVFKLFGCLTLRTNQSHCVATVQSFSETIFSTVCAKPWQCLQYCYWNFMMGNQCSNSWSSRSLYYHQLCWWGCLVTWMGLVLGLVSFWTARVQSWPSRNCTWMAFRLKFETLVLEQLLAVGLHDALRAF